MRWNPMMISNTMWLTIVSALLGILLTLGSRWMFNVSKTQTAYAASLSRLDERTQNIDKAITEIKAGVTRVEDKLDRVLERK